MSIDKLPSVLAKVFFFIILFGVIIPGRLPFWVIFPLMILLFQLSTVKLTKKKNENYRRKKSRRRHSRHLAYENEDPMTYIAVDYPEASTNRNQSLLVTKEMQQRTKSKYCTVCGSGVYNQDAFCVQCGSKL